jgi:hypothetical protein
MQKQFALLMYELGQELDIDLEVDVMNACTILLEEKFRVQFEIDEYKNQLTMACIISVIPPGKFREKILATALKINGVYPRAGAFGYNEMANELILFYNFSLDELTGEKISNHMGIFLDISNQFKNAIDTGDIASIISNFFKEKSFDPFNING